MTTGFRTALPHEIEQMKAIHARREAFQTIDERRFAHALGSIAYAADPKLDASEALKVALMYEQLNFLLEMRP